MPSARARLTTTLAALGVAIGLVVAAAPPGVARQPAVPMRATRSVMARSIHETSIDESSGLARSTYKRGVLWTHNDSGGLPDVYAIRKNGSTEATIRLRGATNRDWEDIAAGPRHRIWVGDVGNNAKGRSVISVYRFKEPRRLENRSVGATRFDFSYPDGRHNSEGIMVSPRHGRLFIVSKDPSGGAVYRAPRKLSTRHVNRLTRVAAAPKKVTAAAFYPNGKRYVLCNYSKAWIYRGLGHAVAEIDKPPLKQGESLEVGRTGKTLYMGSEGVHSPIYRVVVR
jgi:hypothetical protein